MKTWRDNFWERISFPLDDSLCWEWIGALSYKGYGSLWAGYKHGITTSYIPAHRAAWIIFRGALPEKPIVLDHLCRNRKCVNPFHLEAVSNKDNILRGISPSAINAQKTHCYQGHPYNSKNLRVFKDGYRRCFECIKLQPKYIAQRKTKPDCIVRTIKESE